MITINSTGPALLGGPRFRTKPFPPSPVIGKEERRLVKEVLDSGKLSGFIAQPGDHFLGGPKVKRLEGMFREYFGTAHAIACNSATAGLHMAIAGAGIGPGDEVIVTPYTMSASAAAILMAQAIPVFADIDAQTFCVDPTEIEKKITPYTKAIVVVHLFGQAADMDRIMALAQKHKLVVIEDVAQAPGATYKKKFLGTLGDAGVFSLNQHKTITTGEGGVVITSNASIAEKCQLIRNHGEVIVGPKGIKDIVNTLGWNYRMTELEAAVGIGQFAKLDFLTNYRCELARMLALQLERAKLPGLTLPVTPEGNKHVYFTYAMKYDASVTGVKRETFVKALVAEGLPIGQGYVEPIYLEPMYQKKIVYGDKGAPFTGGYYQGNVSYDKGICPVTERMYEKELVLTAVCRYPVKKADIRDVVQAFEKVYAHMKELKEFERKS